MLGWKVAAQVLVVLGAVLSLGPVLQRMQAFLKKTRYRSYFEILCTLGLCLVLAWLVSPYLERTATFWWFTEYTWWKLMLGSFLFALSIFANLFQRYKTVKDNFLQSIPFLLLYISMLVSECMRYSGRLFYFAFLYIFIRVSLRVSSWFSRLLTRMLVDELVPLLLAVFFLSLAAAIQLFILP